MKINLLLITLFFTCFRIGVQAQTTWYISVTGNNTSDGLTPTTAFASINNAIGLSSCGDSIYVLGGTYYEKILATTICPENNRLVIQGDITDRPLIIGDSLATNKYAISASGEGFRFRNLELTSPYPNICSQANQVIVGNGDHFDFIDIIVRNSGYDGIKVYGDCGTSNFAVNWKIINSQIINNGLGCPESIVNGDGIDFTECRNCLIQGSIIKDNQGHQIQIKLESYNVTVKDNYIEGSSLLQIGLKGNTPQCNPLALNADSIYIRNNIIVAKGDTSDFVFKLADVSNLYIENNTIIKDSVGLDVGFICFGGCGSSSNWQYAPSSPTIIRNNIFYSLSTMPFFAGPDTTFFDPFGVIGTQVTSSYNLFYGLNGSYVVPPDNSVTSFIADPLFCNYPSSFELSQGSPCINAGDPSSPNDPDLTQNDIGAIYYQSSCVLSTDENVIKSMVKIFPNPTTGNVTIYADQVIRGAKLNLYNSVGQLIMSINMDANQQNLHLENLKSGVYYFRIMLNDFETIQLGKLIKN